VTRPQSPVQITALGIIALPHSQERHARQHHEPALPLISSTDTNNMAATTQMPKTVNESQQFSPTNSCMLMALKFLIVFVTAVAVAARLMPQPQWAWEGYG
jgi:hypothetical protein